MRFSWVWKLDFPSLLTGFQRTSQVGQKTGLWMKYVIYWWNIRDASGEVFWISFPLKLSESWIQKKVMTSLVAMIQNKAEILTLVLLLALWNKIKCSVSYGYHMFNPCLQIFPEDINNYSTFSHQVLEKLITACFQGFAVSLEYSDGCLICEYIRHDTPQTIKRSRREYSSLPLVCALKDVTNTWIVLEISFMHQWIPAPFTVFKLQQLFSTST